MLENSSNYQYTVEKEEKFKRSPLSLIILRIVENYFSEWKPFDKLYSLEGWMLKRRKELGANEASVGDSFNSQQGRDCRGGV